MSKKSTAGEVVQRFKSSGPWNAGKFDVDQAWNELSQAIDQIYLRNASELQFEVLYRFAYHMVLAKKGEILYNNVSDKISKFVNQVNDKLSNVLNEELLRHLCSDWEYHKIVMGMMRDILLYVDRNYCKLQQKLPVYSLSLTIFRDNLLYHPNLRDKLRRLILKDIESERNGEVIDRDTLRTILTMYQDVSVDIYTTSSNKNIFVYEEEFETPFLAATKEYYRNESNSFLAENSVPEFLKRVELRIKQENERLHQYLSPSTETKLKAVLDAEMISAHTMHLLDMHDGHVITESNGVACIALMRDDKLDDLKRLYMLLSRVPSCLDNLRDCVGEFTRQSGMAIVQSLLTTSASSESNTNPTSIAVQFVTQILDLQSKLENIINSSFKGDKKALQKQQDAFDYFINFTESSVSSKASSNLFHIPGISAFSAASYLSTYFDEILKNARKGSSADLDIDTQIDKAISIFRHITDKDLFEFYYKQLLSKRLLNSKNLNEESERQVVARLKSECGYQYTSKLEGMFKDMQMSKIIMEEYHEYSGTHKISTFQIVPSSLSQAEAENTDDNSTDIIELDIQILTAGYWPLQSVPPCRLAAPLLSATETFVSYYLRKNSGKKLTWLHNLGSVDVKAFFPSGRRELGISTYQACILLCFNKKSKWKLAELKEACDIPDLEFRRHLLSLCTPKLRILKKSSNAKGILEDDEFVCNDEFTSKFKRIKVPLISLKEVSPELGESKYERANPSSVEEDRKNSIDASIVRIMKARKRLSHNELIAEVSKQISSRFNPTPAAIKNRIESLIERDYLERDEKDMRTYTYLA